MAYRDCPCLNCKDRSKKKRERITALLLKCKKSDHKKPPDEKKER